jgi:hypothetical protein
MVARHIILNYFGAFMVCLSVGFMFYFLAKALCKTNKRVWLLVVLLTVFSIFIYIETHKRPHTVIMREDTLYIEPSSDTLNE